MTRNIKVGPFRTLGGACEMCTGRNVRRAKVCVIWERRPMGHSTLEIKHRHLCGSHANALANGYDKGDTWAERTPDECFAATKASA